MKSEFMLAFNEVCEARGLARDVVLEALENALISAYRRNTNVSNLQDVNVTVDPSSGEARIYAEKETVEEVFDSRTEVKLTDAHAAGFSDVGLNEMVMMDSTPANFGRIAAQAAKQVILQRVREAEREMLYEDFSDREGEIVNGTVQSVTGQSITVGLGRTEAILPRSQQVPSERYRTHDKIRVYLLEVRRTNRGPQIIVSRSDRGLLRRLLELEVPEIFNGQVDIKNIAREAGARSKVAVVALQQGIDPVGACVGMRGVRIQSIVRELSDEKIDIIEWDPDQRSFIAKALSPARVSQVFLEDHPIDGKTAIVVVPDDQLSLAIGREGQNARLAAKLTHWRIDIKSLTESASEALDLLDKPSADPEVVKNKELLAQVRQVLAKKQMNRPITSEDYATLNRLVTGVQGRIIAERAATYAELHKARAEARSLVPESAWDVVIEELDLSSRVATILTNGGVATLGEAMLRINQGSETLLDLTGFGPKALEELLEAVTSYELPEEEVVEVEDEPVAEEVEEVVEVDEIEEEEAVEEPIAEEVEETPATASELANIEDLGTSLVTEVPKKQKKTKKKAGKLVRVAAPTESTEAADAAKKSRVDRELVLDEKTGQIVVRRKRKKQGKDLGWEDLDDLTLEEYLKKD